MPLETPSQAFGATLAVAATFFLLGLAGALWAHKLMDPRLAQAPETRALKAARALILAIRLLSGAVVATSLILFYKLVLLSPSIR